MKVHEELVKRALETAKLAIDDEVAANLVAGIMIGFFMKESEPINLELETVSRDRFILSRSESHLREEKDALRASVEFNLEELRRVVAGLEGSI